MTLIMRIVRMPTAMPGTEQVLDKCHFSCVNPTYSSRPSAVLYKALPNLAPIFQFHSTPNHSKLYLIVLKLLYSAPFYPFDKHVRSANLTDTILNSAYKTVKKPGLFLPSRSLQSSRKPTSF